MSTPITLCLVLGDQLTLSLPAIAALDKTRDVILMAEVREEATYVPHHQKKIVLLFSAMRHFAQTLQAEGYRVRYIKYDAPDNQASLFGEVKQALKHFNAQRIALTMPGEWRLYQDMQQWSERLKVAVEWFDDPGFVSTPDEFSRWAKGKKQLRMEFFYREMRKKTGVLMVGAAPEGGQWNFDADNRQPLPAHQPVPKPRRFVPDAITQEVILLVQEHFPSHMGEASDFSYAVTREQALEVLDTFIAQRLCNFGAYQDAMRQGDPWLFHSHISFYLNLRLLCPLEVVERAERAYRQHQVPLNSIEGFVRQVIGWREYVRGFYWHLSPQLQNDNALNATRPLPRFFWDAQTNMNCMRQCISDTRQYAYAHHIQRLMVLGNFCLLTGIAPTEVQAWYLAVYADAYEWVELPNVSGMILFADGGTLASKPYAASGAYINKMSDYCKKCGYSVKLKSGEKACPFNYLYWHFIEQHGDRFRSNPRMAMIYRTYEKLAESQRSAMRQSAQQFMAKLEQHEEV